MTREERYEFIKAVCEREGSPLNPGDTIVSPSSYKAAVWAS